VRPAIKFIKDRLGGSLDGKKIAYLLYDNPSGHEPLAVFEELRKVEKFELKTFAVPPPGVEMGAQILDITQRFRPDFVITHLFGRSPSVALKELKRNGYPLSKVVGFVWGSAEADVEAAGGWSVSRACAQRTVVGGSDGCQSYPSGRGLFGCSAILTEGFDTLNSKKAKALLEQLAG
jgi:hypothetical protein